MSSPLSYSIIDSSPQVNYLEHLYTATTARCISLNHDERIEMQPQRLAVQDALHCGNVERVVPAGTLLHQAIRTYLSGAVRKGLVKDERGEGRRAKSIKELFILFNREVEEGEIHLAETRTRHLAYVVNEMTTSRLVAHDVGEQLMRFKSEGSANAILAKKFLLYCSDHQRLGEVPLAMLIHKMYEKKERLKIYEEARISLGVQKEIETLFDRNGTTMSFDLKIKKLQEMRAGARAGFYDDEFLQVKGVTIHRAIVFAFPSLLDGLMCAIAKRRVSYKNEKDLWEMVADQARAEADDLSGDPAEFLLLQEVALSNPIVVEEREWLHSMHLDPSAMFNDIRNYYQSL